MGAAPVVAAEAALVRFLGLGAVVAVLCSCGQAPVGEVALLRGKVADSEQALESARTAHAFALLADGTLSVIGEGTVEHGRYAFVASVTDRPVMVEAADPNGVPLVRSMVDAELIPRAEVLVQPLSAQSSLQAAVLLELERAGCHTNDIDRAGLRWRLDDATAQRLKELAATDPLTAAAQVHALALAEQAGQLSLRTFLASQGLGWESWRAARAEVLAQLDGALLSGTMAPEVAPGRLQLALDQIDAQFGLDPEIIAYRELRTVSASRAALQSLHAAGFAPAQAYERQLAISQARQSAASLNTLLTLGRAPSAVVQQAGTLNAVLQRDVASAEDEGGVVEAFAQWRDAVRGQLVEGRLSAGLLESWLPDFAQEDLMTGLLGQLGGFETELDGQLEMVARSSPQHFNPQTISGEVSDAWTSFDFEIDHAVQQVAPLNDDHEAAVVSLLIHSQSSFR